MSTRKESISATDGTESSDYRTYYRRMTLKAGIGERSKTSKNVSLKSIGINLIIFLLVLLGTHLILANLQNGTTSVLASKYYYKYELSALTR